MLRMLQRWTFSCFLRRLFDFKFRCLRESEEIPLCRKKVALRSGCSPFGKWRDAEDETAGVPKSRQPFWCIGKEKNNQLKERQSSSIELTEFLNSWSIAARSEGNSQTELQSAEHCSPKFQVCSALMHTFKATMATKDRCRDPSVFRDRA